MKTPKTKGSNAERELIEMFYEAGFAAMRAAGSGASRFPCADVIAGNGKKFYAFECKSIAGDYVHLTYEEIAKLVTFAQKFGAVPYVAVRFENKDWVFLDMARIRYTKGENFKIKKDFAYKDGKKFEELVNN